MTKIAARPYAIFRHTVMLKLHFEHIIICVPYHPKDVKRHPM